MKNKEIIRVLSRLHREKMREINKATKKAGIFAHQIEFFNELRGEFQEQVIRDMLEEMEGEYEWDRWAEKIREYAKGMEYNE